MNNKQLFLEFETDDRYGRKYHEKRLIFVTMPNGKITAFYNNSVVMKVFMADEKAREIIIDGGGKIETHE